MQAIDDLYREREKDATHDGEPLLSKRSASANDIVEVVRYVSLRDFATFAVPEYVPQHIGKIFNEGATSVSTECYNAAAAMFRLCLDLVTKSLLPTTNGDGLDNNKRDKLAPRLEWLFSKNLLPNDLKELASCIRQDGNDGAHDGTLEEREALDLLDFTTALLERVYTEPERLRLAKKRRDSRRAPPEQ